MSWNKQRLCKCGHEMNVERVTPSTFIEFVIWRCSACGFRDVEKRPLPSNKEVHPKEHKCIPDESSVIKEKTLCAKDSCPGWMAIEKISKSKKNTLHVLYRCLLCKCQRTKKFYSNATLEPAALENLKLKEELVEEMVTEVEPEAWPAPSKKKYSNKEFQKELSEYFKINPLGEPVEPPQPTQKEIDSWQDEDKEFCSPCDQYMQLIDQDEGKKATYNTWQCWECKRIKTQVIARASKKPKRKVHPGIGKRKVKFDDLTQKE